MTNLIGRPPDESYENLVCPKCSKVELRKSGFRTRFNQQDGIKRVQAYACRNCRFQTTKPIMLTEIDKDNHYGQKTN